MDNKEFLKNAFMLKQKSLTLNMEMALSTIEHRPTKGEVNEDYIIELLREYLPKRYSVDNAIIIDSNGDTSDQIDVVIYDNQYTPTLLNQQEHKYIPAEAVYAIFEIKSILNKENLEYTKKKLDSVKKLKRTSIEIPHAGGAYPARKQIEVFSGIIAVKSIWTSDIDEDKISEYKNCIKCGLVLQTGESFDFFDININIQKNENIIGYFLFRLLSKLQSLATVPAVDWKEYANVMLK